MHLLLAITAITFPGVAIPLIIANYSKTRRVVPAAFILALLMSLLCMGVVNDGRGDLATYAAEIEKYSGLEFGSFADTKYANYIGSSIVFWGIAQTGNPHLIQLFNGFVEYFVLSYIILDYAKENKYSGKMIALALVAVATLVPLYSSISAIRSTPALDVGLLALYRDLYKNKRDFLTGVLYIAPVTMHAVGLSMLAIRIVVFISRNNSRVCFFLGLLALPVLIFGASIISPLFDGLAVNPVDLLTTYNEQSSIGWAATVSSSTFYQLFRMVNLSFAIVLGIDVVSFLKDNKIHNNTIALFNALLVGLGLIGGFCIFVTDPAFMRYSYAIYPLAVLYITSRSSLMHQGKNGAIKKMQKCLNIDSISIRTLLYIATCTIFFISHCYLFWLGADPVSLFQTILLGVFATPQLGFCVW